MQRFITKVVDPLAPLALQDDQCVDFNAVLASAHVTTRLRGRATDAPEQVRTFALLPVTTEGVACGFVDEEPADTTPKPNAARVIATVARAAKVRRIRRWRSRRFASRNSNSIVGSHGFRLSSVSRGTCSKLIMKLV